MAVRKKAKKKTGTRRHHKRGHVGAMKLDASNPMIGIGSAVAGFFLGDHINPLIDKVTGTMDAKVVGAIQIGLGGALVLMKLGKKKELWEVIPGGVLAGAGLKRELVSFGIINGFEAVPVIGRNVAGYRNVPVIGNGYNTRRIQMNGTGFQVPAPMNSNRVMGGMGSGNGGGTEASCLMG